ncbi:MAG: hypothetical protein SGARI_006609 [Bacillariaceae sp.]
MTARYNKLLRLKEITRLQDFKVDDEYEQHIVSRMYSRGAIQQQLQGYYASESWRKEVVDELQSVLEQVSDPPLSRHTPKLQWWSVREPRTTVRTDDDSDDARFFECDLHVQLDSIPKGGETLGHILGDICNPEDIIQINGDAGADFVMHDGQWLWMELTRPANKLKDKMYQGERAWRLIERRVKETEGYDRFSDDILPSAFVVIIDGDEATFKKAAHHVKQLYQSGQLISLDEYQDSGTEESKGGWRMLSVPVFVVYAPFRNSYLQLADMRKEIGDVGKEIGDIVKKIDENLLDVSAKLNLVLGILVAGAALAFFRGNKK